MIQHIMFDFDGTLADTSEGIVKSMHYAFDKLNLPRVEDYFVVSTIGMPLEDMISMLLKTKDEVYIKNGVEFFRERYCVHGIQEVSLYPGVEDILRRLQVAGKKLYIVSSKPEMFVKQICESYKILSYFMDITGVSLDEGRRSKGERMKAIMEQYHMTPNNAVMVGDRPEDAIAARENHVPCIGMEYGFSTKENLELAGCVKVGQHIGQLKDFLLL